MKSPLVISIAFAISALTCGLASEAQVTDDSPVYVDRLLKEFWPVGVENRRAGESTWQDYRKGHASPDSRVQWAYVLNRIEHDKYREARRAIDDLVTPGSDAWEQRYAQIWLKLMVGEVNSALLDIQLVKDRVVAATGLEEAARFKIFSRLGRLYGYAEGPASEKATPSILLETRARVQDGLNDADFGNFEDHRKQVANQFAELLEEKSTTVATQIRVQKENAETRTAQIISDNVAMGDRQTALVREIRELQTEMSNETRQLRQDARPITSDLSRIESDIRRVDRRIAELANDIAYYETAAFHEPDPYRQADLYARARSLRSRLYSEESQRNNLNGQYNSSLAQLDLISERIAGVERQFGGMISTREGEARQLRGQLKRNQKELKKLQNPKAKTGYVKSMDSRTGHLPTYDPFPTDEFRRDALK